MMHRIKNKRTKRICKWLASWLAIILLINASGIPILSASETASEATSEGSETETSGTEESGDTETTELEDDDDTETTEPEEGKNTETTEPGEEESGEPEPTEPQDECSCPGPCVEGCLNEDCPVCSTEGSENCKPMQSGDTKACICTELCKDGEGRPDCPVCAENPENCNPTETGEESTPEVGDGDEKNVATQEELEEAVSAGVSEITLTDEISLTTTINVPAAANIKLDGQGHSLKREKTFTNGPMLYLTSADGTSASLTLTNIDVNGQIEGAENQTDSPAIISYGNLTLGAGAAVKSNYNYGTSVQQVSEAAVGDTNACGGGILVYGELTVTEQEQPQVTGNFADGSGGGVYLAGGATLYLNADVIKDNSASVDGADLYAASGSTIHYDSTVFGDITQREGFSLIDGVNLIDDKSDEPANPEDRNDKNVEIFINISENSGYTKTQIEEIVKGLEKAGYTVLTNRTDIDTTDLRNWYVYDHYDDNAWAALGKTWESEYGEDVNNPKRTKYTYNESPGQYLAITGDRAYTIADWLEKIKMGAYGGSGSALYLAQFKEHIYSRNEDGYPTMTFVGYGHPAYVDFLFYDPESDGEKVVDFDVDSSQIYTHTLAGSGFLINTGVEGEGENKKLYGYLVYYAYSADSGGTTATSVSIYRLDGIAADALHDSEYAYDFKSYIYKLGAPVATQAINGGEWQNEMSIQIKASPTKIEVRQQPKDSEKDIEGIKPILECTLSTESGYSGFGPLVAYTTDDMTHWCDRASCFTYSNLRMYFTDPEYEQTDMLNPLEKADFTQEGTQKYFLNLFGNYDLNYNDSATFGQYQEYLEMMQREGIALITDKNTPFEEFLGDNLCELSNDYEGTHPIPVEDLIDKIIKYIASKMTTYMEDKVQQEPNGEGLKKASPAQSVGNIWLKSESSGKQIRGRINGDSLPEIIQPMDDISFYYEKDEDITVQYNIIKPNGSIVLLGTVSPDEEGKLTPPSFVVEKDRNTWPAGQYAVQQIIKGSNIRGYAYFDLYWEDTTVPKETFTISVTMGEGGTVSPSGEVVVSSGATQQFVITPDDGYQIDTVLVDNNPALLESLEDARSLYRLLARGLDTKMNAAEHEPTAIALLDDDDNTNAKQYVFENVTSNHTLHATFKPLAQAGTNVPTVSTGGGSSDTSGGGSNTPGGSPVAEDDTSVTPQPNIVPGVPTPEIVPDVPTPDITTNAPEPTSKDSEPKTGNASTMEVYVTIGMIVCLSYLLFYFADGEGGMTEEEKKEIIETLSIWAGRGKRFRKYIAMAIIFMVLAYYHSIGKRITKKWKEICE